MSQYPPSSEHNPYAAPQAPLTTPDGVKRQHAARWQVSYLLGAVRKTLQVNLIMILVVICAAFVILQIERKAQGLFGVILGGSLFVTAVCWPIGIAVGCLGMLGDYLLQLFGWRTYLPIQESIPPVMAEFADQFEQRNSYDKN